MSFFYDKISIVRAFRFTLIAPLAIIATLTANAQSEPGAIEVETKIDRLQAKIGEVFTLTFTAVYDSSIKISAPDIGKTLDTFEVQSALWSEEITFEDGMKARGAEIKLWALGTGQFTIPPIEIPYFTADSSLKTVSTSAYTVTVQSNLEEPVDPSAQGTPGAPEPAPLREPLENPLFLATRLIDRLEFWAVIGAALIIGAFLAWRYLRPKKEALAWVDSRPAWEKAFERLASLRNSPQLFNAEHKAFYSELTNILKEFMGRVISLPALDMTTSELLEATDGQLALKSQKEEMKRVLTQADLVKFAKMSPSYDRPERDFEATYTLVQTVRDREIELQRQEEERKRLVAEAKSKSTGRQDVLEKSALANSADADTVSKTSEADNEVKNV